MLDCRGIAKLKQEMFQIKEKEFREEQVEQLNEDDVLA